MKIVLFLIFFLCCISNFLIFDEILRIQYRNHYLEWVKDRKPHGFFFKPKEIKTFFGMPGFRSWLAFQRRYFSLVLKTPKWINKEPKARKLIFWYRISNVIGFVVWLLFVFIGIQS